MADSFVLLNDGSSFLVLNDGSSKVILNDLVTVPASSGGGIFARIKRIRQPPQVQIEHQEWVKMISAKPTVIHTNDISLKGIPLLRQHMMRWFELKPTKTTDEYVEIKSKPINEKHVHIGVRSKPFWIKSAEILFRLSPKVDDYFITDLQGKSLNGINIIKKAMSMSEVRTFSFRESSQNWESADTLSDLDKRIKTLNDKIDELQRDLNPREKDFSHPSSFVGTVTYTPESNTMEITMNGNVYGFCGVPERIFDAFEGASSKGAFYNRSIRSQFNCG